MLFTSMFLLCLFDLEKLNDCEKKKTNNKQNFVALKLDRAHFLSAKNKILKPKLRNFVALPGSAANL